MPHSVASDLGLHCLPVSHKKDIMIVHCCLVVLCGERADLLAVVGDVYCIFVTFP